MSQRQKILGPAEVADLLGFSRGTIYVMRSRKTIPEPDVIASGGPLWFEKTIRVWAEKTGRTINDEGSSK